MLGVQEAGQSNPLGAGERMTYYAPVPLVAVRRCISGVGARGRPSPMARRGEQFPLDGC